MDVPVCDPPGLATPALRLERPIAACAPVIVAAPHSGTAYPPAFLDAARLDAHALRRSEDSFVDTLFGAAPALGLPLLAATFPRAYCDVNREKWELDPAMFEDGLPPWANTASPRVAAGLGTIARIVASGEPIYRRKLRVAEAEDRVRLCWQPYHDALTGLIGEVRARFGVCLVLDCHSMPAHGPGGAPVPDVVLGDAHGTACAPRATRTVEATLAGLGYAVRRNDPYAGGYVTRHYGRPREGVHVLQIELARGLYMDETLITPLPRFAAVQRDMTALMRALAEAGPELLG
jgi:N-formylglutamate deformylase